MVFAELGQRGYKLARRIVVAIMGGTVVTLGVLMIFTPGPGLLMIAGGLAILALEFAWARHWLHQIKSRLTKEQLAEVMNRTRNVVNGDGGKKSEDPHG